MLILKITKNNLLIKFTIQIKTINLILDYDFSLAYLTITTLNANCLQLFFSVCPVAPASPVCPVVPVSP